ncbi:MAG: hypothetical protein WBP45_12525 [Daejeonella sp.]
MADQLPELAVTGLYEGLDTPSLCILAGLGKNESAFQMEHYFKLALGELKIELPDRKQAAIEYALAIVDEIIEGRKDIIKGTREICYNAIDSCDLFAENTRYCYESSGFETAYGLYDTYDELYYAGRPWQDDKTNEQLMTELKEQLLDEIKKWKDKIENGLLNWFVVLK